MIVCVDVGNTLTKVAIVDAGIVRARGATPTGGVDYRGRVSRVVAGLAAGPARRERAVVSSVVPEATADVVDVVAAHVDAPGAASPLVVSHRLVLPIAVSVARPERVGTDRLCAAAGAVDEGHPDAVVIDVGSAVTVDLVVARSFRGGVILPGPAMMLDALASRASQLPRIDLDAVPTLFPEDIGLTEDAMTLGAALACLGGILEAVRRLTDRAPGAPVWVTGGDAPRFDAYLPPAWRRAPDLCFVGLARIAHLNHAQG